MCGLLAKIPESNPSIILFRFTRVGAVFLVLKVQIQYLKQSNKSSVDLHVT
jgi:hypothetical protein